MTSKVFWAAAELEASELRRPQHTLIHSKWFCSAFLSALNKKEKKKIYTPGTEGKTSSGLWSKSVLLVLHAEKLEWLHSAASLFLCIYNAWSVVFLVYAGAHSLSPSGEGGKVRVDGWVVVVGGGLTGPASSAFSGQWQGVKTPLLISNNIIPSLQSTNNQHSQIKIIPSHCGCTHIPCCCSS